jgi:choline kinase
LGSFKEKTLGVALKAIILAAGIGSRIDRTFPKCLTVLPSGKTILKNQLDILKSFGIVGINVVVGFKKEIIMEKYPDVLYRYNPIYHITNTSKSLLAAMENLIADDLLWINGDVYLEPDVIKRILGVPNNAIAVNRANCGVEEVKYKTNSSGKIIEISKQVRDAEGEAVGVNKISREDYSTFLEALRLCNESDYFEKGMEICIQNGVKFYPVDISDCKCIEIDFQEDLEKVKAFFQQ